MSKMKMLPVTVLLLSCRMVEDESAHKFAEDSGVVDRHIADVDGFEIQPLDNHLRPNTDRKMLKTSRYSTRSCLFDEDSLGACLHFKSQDSVYISVGFYQVEGYIEQTINEQFQSLHLHMDIPSLVTERLDFKRHLYSDNVFHKTIQTAKLTISLKIRQSNLLN